jgi:hypothetical protein
VGKVRSGSAMAVVFVATWAIALGWKWAAALGI